MFDKVRNIEKRFQSKDENTEFTSYEKHNTDIGLALAFALIKRINLLGNNTYNI